MRAQSSLDAFEEGRRTEEDEDDGDEDDDDEEEKEEEEEEVTALGKDKLEVNISFFEDFWTGYFFFDPWVTFLSPNSQIKVFKCKTILVTHHIKSLEYWKLFFIC